MGCPLFDVVHPAVPLPTTASVIFQGAVGVAVVACDIPEPWKFPSLDSYQNLTGYEQNLFQWKLFDIAVTLKYGQGHWKWYRQVKVKK